MKAKMILAALALVATVGVASAQNTTSKKEQTTKTCCTDKKQSCDKHKKAKKGDGKHNHTKPEARTSEAK